MSKFDDTTIGQMVHDHSRLFLRNDREALVDERLRRGPCVHPFRNALLEDLAQGDARLHFVGRQSIDAQVGLVANDEPLIRVEYANAL